MLAKKEGKKKADRISRKMNDYDPQLDNCNSNAPEVKRMYLLPSVCGKTGLATLDMQLQDAQPVNDALE